MRCRLLVFGVLSIHLPAQEVQQDQDPTPVFAWFEAHGYPPLGDKRFVRFSLGDRSRFGFVIEEHGDQLRGLTLEGQQLIAEDTDDITWSTASFDEHLRQTLRLWTIDRSQFGMSASADPSPNQGSVFLMLAWAAHQRGATAHVRQLMQAARETYSDYTKPLAKLLAEDLAKVALWRLILDFGHPEIGWAELASRCEALQRRFPDSRLAASARRMHKVLVQMIADERRHVQTTEPRGRFAELVFRLREQNGRPGDRPGQCDVFADPRGTDSPAAQLAAAGTDAIEHLLPAFDSDRFSRSVACFRSNVFSHRVLTVGAVALQVFARITGYETQSPADARRWWQDYQSRGAIAVYSDGALSGNAELARRLLLIDPDIALVTISEALNTARPMQTTQLLAVLSGLPDPQAAELLATYLRESPSGDARLTAAGALCLRGRAEEAIDGVIDAWKTHDPQLSRPALGRFLITCGRRRALAAVFERPDKLDQETFRLLASGDHWPVVVLRPDGSGKHTHWQRQAQEDGFDEDVERLLGSLIDAGTDDVDRLAARELTRRWPEIYDYEAGARAADQQAMLQRIRATWRKRQGLPDLPGR